MLAEVNRSVHDCICAVKRVLEEQHVIAGGGSVEANLSVHLDEGARNVPTME